MLDDATLDLVLASGGGGQEGEPLVPPSAESTQFTLAALRNTLLKALLSQKQLLASSQN